MNMTLLPDRLRVVLAVVLCGVLVVHLWHARTMTGQRRWWHLGHTAMAAGMALMYAVPMMGLPALQGGVAALFAASTVVSAGAAVLLRREEGVLNPLWVASALDMLAMTYMLLPHGTRLGAVTAVFVLYLTVQAVAWLLGLWDRIPVVRTAVLPGRAATALAPGSLADGPAGGVMATAGSVGLTAHSTPVVRASLAVMAASMAGMFLVM